jgi:hypothetical protein
MTAENGLPERLDVGNPFVEGNHNRQTPKEQDEYGDYNQSPNGDAERRIIEAVEGCPSSDVYEAGDVEEKVDYGTEDGLLGLLVEETIPSKGGTTAERSKEVIDTEHGGSADYQKSEGDILSNGGLAIDQLSALAKFHEMPEAETEDGTVDDGEQDFD